MFLISYLALKSEVMKKEFHNFGHPSPVSKPKITPEIGETVDYESLEAVALPETDKNYDKTILFSPSLYF